MFAVCQNNTTEGISQWRKVPTSRVFKANHVCSHSLTIAWPYCHRCGLCVTSHLAIEEHVRFCVIIQTLDWISNFHIWKFTFYWFGFGWHSHVCGYMHISKQKNTKSYSSQGANGKVLHVLYYSFPHRYAMFQGCSYKHSQWFSSATYQGGESNLHFSSGER